MKSQLSPRKWAFRISCAVRGLGLWGKKGYPFVLLPAFMLLTGWLVGARWNLLTPIALLGTVLVAVEIFNTAIEKLCNLIDGKNNKKIKNIKDICASAVLVFGIALTATWLWVIISVLVEKGNG